MCLWHSLENCQLLATHFLLQQWLHISSDNHKEAQEVAERWRPMQANYDNNAKSAAYSNNSTSRSRPFCWRHYKKRMSKSRIFISRFSEWSENDCYLLPNHHKHYTTILLL